MLKSCFALTLVLAVSAASARAQNPVPDAPLPAAPTPPASAKPAFTVPPVSFKPPSKDDPPLPKPDDGLICNVPPDGEFTTQNKHIPDQLLGQMESYNREVAHRIDGQWVHSMSLGERNAWAHSKTVALRFAIRPDGTLVPPEITVSSGHPNDDKHALEAVSSVHRFPPLPAGFDHPLVYCFRFGYNTMPWSPAAPDALFKNPPKKP